MTTPIPLAPAQSAFLPGRRLARLSYRLTAATFLVAGILTGGGLLVNATLSLIQRQITAATYAALPLGLLIIIWTFMSASATFLTSAHISIEGDDLLVRVAGPWRLTYPLRQLAPDSITVHTINLPYRRLAPDERLFAIALRNFRPACRLAAMYVGVGIRPHIFITPDHEQQEALVAALHARIEFPPHAQE